MLPETWARFTVYTYERGSGGGAVRSTSCMMAKGSVEKKRKMIHQFRRKHIRIERRRRNTAIVGTRLEPTAQSVPSLDAAERHEFESRGSMHAERRQCDVKGNSSREAASASHIVLQCLLGSSANPRNAERTQAEMYKCLYCFDSSTSMPRGGYSDKIPKKTASIQPRGISIACLSLEPVWRPRAGGRPLAPLHDTRQVEIYDRISLMAFAHSILRAPPVGRAMDRFVSNLVNLPSHLVGKLGDVALT